MKKILLSALALAALTASAQTFDPAAGSSMDYLSVFKITYPDAARVVAENPEYYGGSTTPAYVTFNGEKVRKLVSFPSPFPGNTVEVQVTPDMATASYVAKNGITGLEESDLCAEGVYTFVIPAGAFTVYNADNSSFKSEEISFTYTFGEVKYSSTVINIDGPTGTVDEVVTATLTFDPVPETLEINDPSGFMLKDKDSASMGYGAAFFEATVNDDMTVTLTLPEPYITAGKFDIYVWENALLINGEPNLAAEGETFTVTGDLRERSITVMPDPAVPLKSLQEVTLIYEGYTQLSYSVSMQQMAKVARMYDPAGKSHIYLCSNGPYDFSLAFWPMGNSDDPDLPGDAFTTPGEYRFEIPAGFIKADNVSNEEAIVYYFTVAESSSVGELEAAGKEAAWYDLNGVRVERPAKGLYIRVDGKGAGKVVVK